MSENYQYRIDRLETEVMDLRRIISELKDEIRELRNTKEDRLVVTNSTFRDYSDDDNELRLFGNGIRYQ